jgi:hypothetical protein
MLMFHGTTSETLRSIRSHGLRKGTFVTPDRDVALFFARARSRWNGEAVQILEVIVGKKDVSKVTLDRSGRPEATLTKTVFVAQ